MADDQSIFNQPRLDKDLAVKQGGGGGLFKKESKQAGLDISGMVNEVNSLSRRVRVMEERYNNLRRKSQISDQNMLLQHKKVMNEVHVINDDVLEIKRDIMDVKEKVKLIIKELQACAKKEDLDVLNKYISLWEPVNFVTRNEVERVVNELLTQMKSTGK